VNDELKRQPEIGPFISYQLSEPTALALERVFRRPAHLWLNLQRHFDEAQARQQEFALSADWVDWFREFPIKEMKRRKFSLPAARSDMDSLLGFFGVSSPTGWNSVWKASQVAYRQTRRFKTSEGAIAAWVREAELVAQELDTAEFDERRLSSSIEQLRGLTRLPADEIMDPLQEVCAAAGVAVVLVQELPNTGISGCARWLSESRALIGLTLRYKTDDQFWFTFFHELGHILLHKGKRSFVIDNAAKELSDLIVDPEMQRFEAEANTFSSDTLLPPAYLAAFVRTGNFTSDSIHDFAESLGVGPGIVVGRLQHDKLLGPDQGNGLKQKLNWEFAR